MIVLQVLGGLAGALLIAAGLVALIILWARRKLRTVGYCEFCWAARRAYLANIDEREPLNICETCVEKKIGRFGRENMTKSGKLVRVFQ